MKAICDFKVKANVERRCFGAKSEMVAFSLHPHCVRDVCLHLSVNECVPLLFEYNKLSNSLSAPKAGG